MEKIKITQAGQPCRHCKTPVVKTIGKANRNRIGKQKYYYEWYFKCPNCRATFTDLGAKRVFTKDEKENRSLDPNIEKRNIVLEIQSLLEDEKLKYKSSRKQINAILKIFWHYFGWYHYKGIRFDREKRIKALQYLASLNFDSKYSLYYRRKVFEDKKQKRYKKTLINYPECFGCLKKPNVRHHMIQLQNGGNNIRKNIVSLCNSCHAEIHPWLKNI
jgi:hypothetical protein